MPYYENQHNLVKLDDAFLLAQAEQDAINEFLTNDLPKLENAVIYLSQDPFQDPDDTRSFELLLQVNKWFKERYGRNLIGGIIVELYPAEKRAAKVKGLLAKYGITDIPVVIGHDFHAAPGNTAEEQAVNRKNASEELDYIGIADGVVDHANADEWLPGEIRRVVAEGKTPVMFNQTGYTTLNNLSKTLTASNEEALLKSLVTSFMGQLETVKGVDKDGVEQEIVPHAPQFNSSQNPAYDPDAAKVLMNDYINKGKFKSTSIVTTNAAQLYTKEDYEILASIDKDKGAVAKNIQLKAFGELLSKTVARIGSVERKKFVPIFTHPAWIALKFLGVKSKKGTAIGDISKPQHKTEADEIVAKVKKDMSIDLADISPENVQAVGEALLKNSKVIGLCDVTTTALEVFATCRNPVITKGGIQYLGFDGATSGIKDKNKLVAFIMGASKQVLQPNVDLLKLPSIEAHLAAQANAGASAPEPMDVVVGNNSTDTYGRPGSPNIFGASARLAANQAAANTSTNVTSVMKAGSTKQG